MYCIKCGVRLSDSEKKCPLCGTVVFHPDIRINENERTYPKKIPPGGVVYSNLKVIITTIAFLLPVFTVLICDFQISGGVSWSGYVIGGLLVLYVSFVLPAWFRNPNPVIFVPCSFLAVGLLVLYIDLATGGGWFLSFGFPAVGGLCLIATAVTVLLKYVRKGKFYTIGGAFIAFGVYLVLIEFLICITFESPQFIGWSFYPLLTFVLLGGFFIYLAISRTAREMMERKFFI